MIPKGTGLAIFIMQMVSPGSSEPTPPSSDRRPDLGRGGFTLIEVLSVLAIMGLLAGFAMPKLHQVTTRAKIAKAIGDIRAIQIDLMAMESEGTPLPNNLAAIGRAYLDPWGNPYVYNKFPPPPPPVPHGARRDRFLVPINSTFDLYSMGPDGQSVVALTASKSLDDIIRANDGGYIGLASQY